MTGVKQVINDLKLIVQTDRRVWAAASFIVIVTIVWVSTGNWRGEDITHVEDTVRFKVEQEKIKAMIKEFNKDMRQGREEQDYINSYLTRFQQELEVEKQEMDWHVDVLVNKLNNMVERVDNIAIKVGEEKSESIDPIFNLVLFLLNYPSLYKPK